MLCIYAERIRSRMPNGWKINIVSYYNAVVLSVANKDIDRIAKEQNIGSVIRNRRIFLHRLFNVAKWAGEDSE